MAAPVNEYRYSFWDCFSPSNLCLKSCCCSCVVAGRVHHRLGPEGRNDEAYDTFNPFCLGYAALNIFTGCGWILAFMDREELRKRYNMSGSGGTSCAGAYCCTCCQLMQSEKELEALMQAERAGAGSAPEQGYQQPEQMVATPPSEKQPIAP